MATHGADADADEAIQLFLQPLDRFVSRAKLAQTN